MQLLHTQPIVGSNPTISTMPPPMDGLWPSKTKEAVRYRSGAPVLCLHSLMVKFLVANERSRDRNPLEAPNVTVDFLVNLVYNAFNLTREVAKWITLKCGLVLWK